MTKITDTELKELDSRFISLLKKIAPEKFEDVEDPAELANKRRSAIEELRTLKERKKKLPALEKNMKDQFEKLKAKKEEYKELGKIFNRSRTDFNGEAYAVTTGIEKCERILMKTSSKELRKKLVEIKAKVKSLRETTLIPEKIRNEAFPKTGYEIITTYPKIIKKLDLLQTEMNGIISEMINQGVE